MWHGISLEYLVERWFEQYPNISWRDGLSNIRAILANLPEAGERDRRLDRGGVGDELVPSMSLIFSFLKQKQSFVKITRCGRWTDAFHFFSLILETETTFCKYLLIPIRILVVKDHNFSLFCTTYPSKETFQVSTDTYSGNCPGVIFLLAQCHFF